MAQSRREFLKTLGVGGAGLVLASPILNLLTPEQASADSLKFNPFHQPINTNEYYGSGDVDGDGDIDGEYYDLISTSEKRLEMFVSNREMAERADVVPDEVLDEKDGAMIKQKYAGGNLVDEKRYNPVFFVPRVGDNS